MNTIKPPMEDTLGYAFYHILCILYVNMIAMGFESAIYMLSFFMFVRGVVATGLLTKKMRDEVSVYMGLVKKEYRIIIRCVGLMIGMFGGYFWFGVLYYVSESIIDSALLEKELQAKGNQNENC